MANILCKNCNKILGTTSQERDDDLYKCSACYQEKTLDYALKKGKIANHEFILDDTLKEIMNKYKNTLKDSYLGERLEKFRK